MGQVHPLVAERFGVEGIDVYAAEVDLDRLLSLAHEEVSIQPLPKYPAVQRDLALIAEEAGAALAAVEELLTGGEPTMRARTVLEGTLRKEDYLGRMWVTRPGPKVDRMACAWLIRRFVDAGAQFTFAPKPEDAPDAVPFDMYGVGFSHQGDACSLETLLARFDIRDAAANRVAQIVHDLDLKDEKYSAPEAGAVGRMVEGPCQMYADDQERLEHGMRMFEALYQSFLANPSGAGSTRAKSQRK